MELELLRRIRATSYTKGRSFLKSRNTLKIFLKIFNKVPGPITRETGTKQLWVQKLKW